LAGNMSITATMENVKNCFILYAFFVNNVNMSIIYES